VINPRGGSRLLRWSLEREPGVRPMAIQRYRACQTKSVSSHAGGLRVWSSCYFVLSFIASFVSSMASSTFSPAFSTGPFSGHALVASAIDDKARTTTTLRMIFMRSVHLSTQLTAILCRLRGLHSTAIVFYA
jgi:hypothetical protein